MALGLLFVYVMTYGGALVSLLNPFWGLAIYISFSMLRPEGLWHWSVPPGNYSRIVALAMLVGWLQRSFGRWQFGRARAIVWSIFGYMMLSIVSAMLAPDQEVAWSFIENTAKVVLPFMVGVTIINSPNQLRKLAWVMVASSGFVAYECNLAYYDGWNVKADGFGGHGDGELNVIMLCGFYLAFFLGLYEKKWPVKLCAFGSAVLMAHVILFSLGRGGMLGLLAAAPVALMSVPKKPQYLVAFALAAAVILRLAGPMVQERFGTIFADKENREGSAQSRLDLWRDMWDVIQKNPVIGIGPDHFPLVSAQYGWPKGKEGHNTWMQQAAELGIPAAGLLITFYGICIFKLARLLRLNNPLVDPLLKQAARMSICALIGFSVAAQFATLEGAELPYYIVMLGTSALIIAEKESRAEHPFASIQPEFVSLQAATL